MTSDVTPTTTSHADFEAARTSSQFTSSHQAAEALLQHFSYPIELDTVTYSEIAKTTTTEQQEEMAEMPYDPFRSQATGDWHHLRGSQGRELHIQHPQLYTAAELQAIENDFVRRDIEATLEPVKETMERERMEADGAEALLRVIEGVEEVEAAQSSVAALA